MFMKYVFVHKKKLKNEWVYNILENNSEEKLIGRLSTKYNKIFERVWITLSWKNQKVYINFVKRFENFQS